MDRWIGDLVVMGPWAPLPPRRIRTPVPKVKELKEKVKVLEEKNRLLQEQLAAEKLSNAIVVKNAELEMANALQPQLLRQYQIGLQDGANLTMGSKLNMPMASPVSLGGLSQGSSSVSGLSGSTPVGL